MKKLLLIFCFYPLLLVSQLSLHQWDDSFYNKYNYSSFQRLNIVHSEIELTNIDYELLNAAIFYSTNVYRVRNGRKPFKHSSSLERAAQAHSKDMVEFNFFSHTSTVSGKKSMSDRLSLVGIKNSYAGENIALRKISSSYWNLASALLNQWMNSQGHRENILNSNYNYLGCGSYDYINRNYGGVYVKSTQNFSSIDGSIIRNDINNSIRNTTNTTNISNNNIKKSYILPPKQEKPYKFLIKIGSSAYSDIYMLEDNDNIFDLYNIKFNNRLNSLLIGYREDLDNNKAKFSKSGRDMNRGNVYGLIYNYGKLSDISFLNLNASNFYFKEIHLTYSWREFFTVSYGHGTYFQDKILSNILQNNEYKIISSGVNLRFGRVTVDYNVSFLSDDNFQSMSHRINMGLGMNIYFFR